MAKKCQNWVKKSVNKWGGGKAVLRRRKNCVFGPPPPPLTRGHPTLGPKNIPPGLDHNLTLRCRRVSSV